MPRFRRSGRSSPALSSPPDACGSIACSRNGSGAPIDGGSPATSPPNSGRATAAAPTTRSRPRPSTQRTLFLALLPALVALGTVASMSRRQSAHSELADALLAESAAGMGGVRGSRQLGEAADPAEGAECAKALQIPQVRCRQRAPPAGGRVACCTAAYPPRRGASAPERCGWVGSTGAC